MQQLKFQRAMGQKSPSTIQNFRRSYDLYHQQAFPQALEQIIPFLNSELSGEDLKIVKNEVTRRIDQNNHQLTNYFEWLCKSVNINKQRIDNLFHIFVFAHDAYSQNSQSPSSKDLLQQLVNEAFYLKYYNRAVQFKQINQFQSSINQLSKLITMFPLDSRLFFNIGVVYQQLKQFQFSQMYYLQALQIKQHQKCFLKLISLYEEYGQVQKQQKYLKKLIQFKPNALVYKQKYAEFLLKLSRYSESVTIYKQIIQLSKIVDKNLIEEFDRCVVLGERYEQAVDIYTYLILVEPNNGNYFLRLGVSFKQLLKKDEAIYWLERALQIKKNSQPLNHLIQIYKFYELEEDLFDCYAKLFKLNPQNPQLCKILGDHFSRSQLYFAEALQYYDEQIEYEGDSYQVFENIGRLQQNKGQYSKSIEFYQKAIQLEQTRYYPYILLASVQMQIERYNQAIVNLEKALHLQPKNSKVLNLLGSAYYKIKEDQKALNLYKKAMQINPNDQNSYFNLALLYFDKHQYELALQYSKKCISIKSYHPSAFYLISQICLRNNQQFRAIQYLEQIIAENPINFMSFHQLGNIYFEFGRLELALKNYKIAFDMGSKQSSTIYMIGTVCLLLTDYKQSQKWFLQALKMYENDKQIQCGYALSLLKLNKFQQANQLFYKIIDLNPQYYEPYFYLGRVINLMGMKLNELQSYQKILDKDDDKKESIALFYRGLNDTQSFYFTFVNIVESLKNTYANNEKYGKRAIWKFVQQFISHIHSIIKISQQSDMLILLAIFYKDIGDEKEVTKCFQRLITQDKFKSYSKLNQKMLFLYTSQLKALSADYSLFLLQFLMQQLLQIEFGEALQFYKQLLKTNQELKKAYNLRTVIDRQIQAKILQIIVKYGSAQTQEQQDEISQIEHKYLDKIIDIFNNAENSSLETIKHHLTNLFNQIILRKLQEMTIKKQVVTIMESNIHHYAVSATNMFFSTVFTQKQKVILNVERVVKLFADTSSITRIIVVVQEILPIILLSQQIQKQCLELIASLPKRGLNIQSLLDEIGMIVTRTNTIFPSVFSITSQDSSIMYEHFIYQQVGLPFKKELNINQSIGSRLSKEFVLLSQHINKQNMINCKNRHYQSIFQKQLPKPRRKSKKVRSQILF